MIFRLIFLFFFSAISAFASIEVDAKYGIVTIDGTAYPLVGFGTARMTGKSCIQAVQEAVKRGYAIIDTATAYGNFEAVRDAIKGKDRRQIYLISKVWHDCQWPKDIKADLQSTLDRLQIDYLDAYLIHWPNSQIPIEKTLAAMDKLRQEKKIRHIGLSNVTVNHLKRALKSGIEIHWVQVEMNPNFYDADLLAFCQANGIAVQAWAPLSVGSFQNDPLLKKIGKKYRKLPAQIALRWIVQHGCVPLPKSENPRHILENQNVFDFALSKEEMDQIDQRAQAGPRTRLCKEIMGFADEFDFSYEECWPKNS